MICLVLILSAISLFLYFAMAPGQVAKAWLFYPVKTNGYYTVDEKMFGATGKHVQFRSSKGVLLHGLHLKNPEASHIFLLHYGQGGNIGMNIGLSKMALMTGQSVFTYDYAGYGMSAGEPSCAAIVDSGMSAHDFLVEKLGYKPKQIIHYGVSLGSGVASAVAMERQVGGVVLFCPYTSMYKAARQRLPYMYLYPDSMFPKPHLGSLSFVESNKNTPVFVWHGERDPIINVSHTRELLEKSNGNLSAFIQEDKSHGDWSLNEMSEKMKEFVEKVAKVSQ